MRLATVLEDLRRRGLLVDIKTPLNSFDITYITRKAEDGPTFVFHKVEGSSSNIPVVTNLCNTRDKLLRFFGVSSDEKLYETLLRAESLSPSYEIMEFEEASFARRELKPDLTCLPILKYYPKDPGPYITSGIVVAKSINSDVHNASFHRMLVVDRDKLVVRIVPRHLWRLYQEARLEGRPLPIAILIGVHPILLVAAACSPPFGVYELVMANNMVKDMFRYVKLPDTGIVTPADVEIVIEGRLTFEERPEGPFVDLMDIYDIKRNQPIIEVDRIWLSSDPVYHAIVPASAEHRILMSIYREALIWNSVRKVVPRVHKVRLTKGSCGWLHAVISLEKSSEGDAKNAILAAFAAHPSLKAVIVVDPDIDVDNPHQIEWALATRFQPGEDLIIIRGARGSSLDPSADQVTLLTDKIGIDATKSILKPSSRFERVKVPYSPRGEEILQKLGLKHVS